MKIIFDLDHTLLSTGKFYRLFENSFVKLGVDRDFFRSTFEKSRDKMGNYRTGPHFRIISRSDRQLSPEKLKKAFKKILGRLDRFLYPDAPPFFKRMRGRADFILLSYGSKDFQRRKIDNLKIKSYFKKIIITEDVSKAQPLKKFLKVKERAVFIDDNPGALYQVKKSFPEIITVRINRGEGRYRAAPGNKNIDFTVGDLKELSKILDKI